MAKSKKDKVSQFGEHIGAKTIIQLPLSPEDVQRCQAMEVTEANVMKALADLVDQGYEVGVMLNTLKAGYSCYLRAPYAEMPNGGSMFYSNGPTLFEALVVMIFKHTFLTNGVWSAHSVKAENLYS